MKKFLALLLAICLLTSFAPVMAEKTITEDKGTAEMEVNLTIDHTLDTFKVVIPSSLTIDPVSKSGEATIEVVKDGFSLISCRYLRVYLKSAASKVEHTNMYLICGKNTIAYSVYTAKTSIYPGDNVIVIDRDKQDEADFSKVLTISVFDLPTVAGTYTDTLTFGVACANTTKG